MSFMSDKNKAEMMIKKNAEVLKGNKKKLFGRKFEEAAK